MRRLAALLLAALMICSMMTFVAVSVSAESDEELTEVSIGFAYTPTFDWNSLGSMISQKYGIDVGSFALDFDIGPNITRNGEQWNFATLPFPVGEYTIELQYGNPVVGVSDPLICHISIAKADPKIVIFPEPIPNLSYSSTDNVYPLITAGKTNGGTMVYSLSGDVATFTETIPTTGNVNGPGLYPVYFKVIGDENYNDFPVDFITVKVEPEKAGDSNTSGGSVFSDGSMTIICTVVALAVGLVGGFFIGKKKKTVEE